MDELAELIEKHGLAAVVHELVVYCSESAEAEQDDDKADAWEDMADEFSDLEKHAEEF